MLGLCTAGAQGKLSGEGFGIFSSQIPAEAMFGEQPRLLHLLNRHGFKAGVGA